MHNGLQFFLKNKSLNIISLFPQIYMSYFLQKPVGNLDSSKQKYSRLRCLLLVKGLVICFCLGWSGSILQFRQNIIKVGSKSWLLTFSNQERVMMVHVR